jgi:isoamylase
MLFKYYASINFITAHDGFTLQDLVTYNEKHNEANGEENRDGNNNNLSWNCGAEGPTDDANIQALRAKQKRNLLAMLLLSQGVPMLYAGDAIGHTQLGNNNAYCHGWQEMIFFDRLSSSTAFSTWQPKNARQTLGNKLVCI